MTRLVNDIREAGKPIHCSACFNSQDIRHIDFDAACDRGYANEEAVQVVMDDLILCENCVRAGARLLGMEDEGVNTERISDLERKLEIKDKLYKQASTYADNLEDAFESRPMPIQIDHRKKPRKQLEEVA
jgi:hypothetical protein